MDINEDTIPELQPIFTFLNSHANKLYQEGYFLKLDDQNTQGKPNADRTWTECFAQLVGTVLSLWDAAELDAAGEDGEVLPKFINLTDASIKMIESLPTRSNDEQPLQNILSISTAGRNRYLLHFNSHHSLIQWTAGIRLAIFEHSTLQEAYTGALIAGKGKSLNNINLIMDRSKFKTEEWVRVRFGAGVPWRRCWCVISPPDEKEYQKAQKEMRKKSPYDRSTPVLKGSIKFYDTKKDGKKQKKARPIATITDAYSSYAIYPQAKALIDASTLLKIEGNITIHSEPPSSTEGFVFIMPETHPAVSGFEMLLRFLFPTWDTFALYGRPGRLVASVLDPRSLMFAMPKHRRYGYLEILDVSGLILTEGSSSWTEREWRKRLKELTGKRMNAVDEGASTRQRSGSKKSARLSFGNGSSSPVPAKPRVGFADDGVSNRSSRSMSLGAPNRSETAPVATSRPPPVLASLNKANHARNSSDPHLLGHAPPPRMDDRGYDSQGSYNNSYNNSPARGPTPVKGILRSGTQSSDDDTARSTPVRDLENTARNMESPEPVAAPPAFNHGPQSKPAGKPYHSPDLRRATSRLSNTTLSQLAKAGGFAVPPDNRSDSSSERRSGEDGAGPNPLVQSHAANTEGGSADNNFAGEALTHNTPSPSDSLPPPIPPMNQKRSRSPLAQNSFGPPSPHPRGPLPPDPQPRGPPDARAPQDGRPPHQMRSPVEDQQPQFPPHDARPPQGMRGPQQMRSMEQMRSPVEGQAPGFPPQGRPQPNFSRPEGTGTPPIGGPGRIPTPEMRNRGMNQMGPPPPQHRDHRTGRGFPLPELNTANAIQRKPLPTRSDSLKSPQETPISASSGGSWGNNIIDQAAFSQIQFRESPRRTPVPEQQLRRMPTQQSDGSYYDDAASTASPDYASRKSSETQHSQKSYDRPRAGVLKTVGGADSPVSGREDFAIPDVNFGPTVNYGANQPARNKTPTPLNPQGIPNPQRPFSPALKSPPYDGGHNRQESEDTVRKVAWQPGAAAVGNGQGMTAEQFVQQRAAQATTPMYGHGRTPSGNILTMRSMTPTPSMTRNTSAEMLAARHSRSSSADLLQRPGSRGANAVLEMSNQAELPSHLSAREQEHVARMTGSPLISMAGNRNANQGQGAGLVGAIQARERERMQAKQGMNTQAVQQAINQRQQQQAMAYQQQVQRQQQQQQQQQLQQQQQQAAYQQQMFAQQQQVMSPMSPMSPQGMYAQSNMSRGQMSQMGPPRGQPNGYGASVQNFGYGQGGGYAQGNGYGQAAYGQGGGYVNPMAMRQGRQSPGPQMMDPRFMPQGAYSPGHQQATQNVLDPRRIGKQNSGFSDEDISDIICVLYPHSDFARREVNRIAREHLPHVVGREEADAVEPDYEEEDRADQFQLTPPNSDYAVILRLSAQTKDPLQGFQFGRNVARCDICFASDPMKRLSNVHFRIYVNDYGVVMLEDSSTNGTFVDGTLLRSKQKSPNERCDIKRVLSHGSRIKVLMHDESRDLEFLVRIPKRTGEYDRAYIGKLEEYWAKLEALRARHNETITPGPGGHVDLFNNAPRRPPNPPPRRIALPSGTTQDNNDRFPREWDGSGKYNRVGQIGKGAFAVVYKVTSKFDGNPYAAKELEKRRFIKNGVLDQKVENEMRIMQRVQHPNIVRYIEHFDWDNRLLIIIMEFVSGGDLGKLITNRGPLQEQSVQQMASQLLSALAHLHENNITHRDVKPDNILIHSLTPFDVKLTDFGLSKMVDNEQTFLRTFCGTLLYCAPEVYSEYAEYDDQGRRNPRNRVKRAAVGQRYDHAIDVWSLGGVLFYALTGSPPYPVRNNVSYSELLHNIMTTPLNTRPLALANVSQCGIDFLRLMLEKRPESRATVKDLQAHAWLAHFRTASQSSFEQSFDEIIDEEEELQINASQLSLQDGQSRTLADTEPPFEDVVDDDLIDDFIEEESEKENGTFGPPGHAGQRLFGEVNVSAVGSSGVIPEDRLNLGESSVLGTDSLETEIRDSYDSEDASTIVGQKHLGSGARLSVSALNGQSADQLHSLVMNVASQSLGATEADFQMKSAATSQANETFYTASKRKPSSVDTSDEFEPIPRDKPAFKRLKSEGNLDALAEREMDRNMEEYKLLASVPQIRRLESGRQIDRPVNKNCFWGSDLTTWHLRYPEMTQLQYDMFQQAARSRNESFAAGKSPLWELAFKHFPPSNGLPAMHVNEPSTINDTKTMFKRDDSRPLEGTEMDIPATAPQPEEEDSLPDTLPPETQQIIVPVLQDESTKRAVAVLESSPESVVSGISVPVTGLVMSWGRGPENTIVYNPKTEVKVPKYAAKLMLWKEGFDSSKYRKTLPWEKDDNGDGFAFYLSTKATNGVMLNKHQLPSHDCKNPLSASKNWIPIYDGDEIVVWGTPTDDTSQTKVTFRCFWGDSAKPRPNSVPLQRVPSTIARKIDEACAKAEKNAKTAKQRLAKMNEANEEYEERKQNIEKERERSRIFEEKRLEALRYVAIRTTSRRGSPASAPATTALRGQTPALGVPSPLQDSQSPPK
ncbi:ph domain protein [Colletotrichum karsti]|uniref:Autophagy-related protein 1 n=1 Tax=Colletotrichum karsti TaxID=1095194 RepID=A0A9P6LKR6_9PEZI|nr:ph domain protein [Colletotrichum karsti]KAF9876451.1 ph domain protein [Colletotrichum karsti]